MTNVKDFMSENEAEVSDNEHEDLSEDNSEYVVGESDVDDDDENWVADCDFEAEIDWTTVLPKETFASETENGPTEKGNSSSNTIFDDESGDSDELHTPPGSDDEDMMEKYPTFKDSVELVAYMTFNNKGQVRDAIKDYAMYKQKNIYLKQNDSKRMVVKCEKGCPFHIRFSKRVGNQFWQLVSLVDEHHCHRKPQNKQAKTEWLAKKFMHTLRATPDMKPKGLVAEAIDKWGVKLSFGQAYRAKRRAIEMIEGAGREQFSHLRTYANELRNSNPNSTVIIKCVESNTGPIFERIYVCLEACKAGFAYTCRPLIGLDACFLKGDFGGQLMAAVGKDGNNKMFPIAYAVVEAETKESWLWFLDLLLEDLQSIQPKNYAFISDQQKGLVPAIQSISEHVEQRLCVKHLYGNWRKKHPGMELKQVLWMAARATTIPAWERAMQRMKGLDENAWKDMMATPAKFWSRSHFKTDTQCDLQVNNMCEAFNRAILEYRDKPIITLLEGIKHYLTKRIGQQKETMLRYEGNICPRIQKVLEKTKKTAEGWISTWHYDDDYAIFGVTNGVETYTVNLLQKTCACRKWDLTGIPCCHVIACIWDKREAPEDYVSSYYRKSTTLATYSHIILPTNGPQLWPLLESDPINPPYMRRAIGRPKKNRNKRNDEPRNPNIVPRSLPTVECKQCKTLGHNKRSCKGKSAAERVIPKGGNKEKLKKQYPAAETQVKVKPKKKKAKNDQGQTVIDQGSQAPPQTQDSQA
ncbi:hypothetical protein L195_g022770 [Trifolium pratense]|uniref:SWIM-type domain-containing protein n=1 Tax=Trifolium pratense TaxID=57577 RepID=A0A2K3N920_TRIPR|nr:hypothetical protein L195_g022770 [Trifolium pratense]